MFDRIENCLLFIRVCMTDGIVRQFQRSVHYATAIYCFKLVSCNTYCFIE